MITKGPLNQLFVTHLSTPGSFLELSGLEDPDVINGVLYLRSIGLLTPERSLEILKKY